MFDRIAPRYDLLNRIMSLGRDRAWRRRAIDALELSPGARLLDLATGTGDLALEALARHPRIEVVGLDPSPRMLALAAAKARRAGAAGSLRLLRGDAQALPFAAARFDAAAMAFGIRNVPDRERALREIARVLRPGGRLAVLELGSPRGRWAGAAARAYIRSVVPRLGALLSRAPEYRYLERSIAAFPAPESFSRTIRECGFESVQVRPLALGACHLYRALRSREGSP
ncbi:MAG: bifunctional demethylmenaquinone methyltransferase/2-methoxy-6-polyprenyl-1,4-benzoquinol methylase UbiE [Acidobacteria bacterium]|nr:MAG: bifunctional demethylmenaquinone methyltransferase/2-methoxy-6-polyprenyl-1,4-benzoquinol methylase UbiE [Acidobacteriota bacterium]